MNILSRHPKLAFALATWFGCGLARKAPGTWGTLGALPPGVLLLWLGGWPALLVAAALVSVVGFYAAEVYEKETGTHDSGAIVIDEVAGMWIALGAAVLSPLSILLAFVLFRAFDILKPGPVGWADRKLPGALGVMADDVIAGILAALCVGGLRLAGIG